jgi:hypothetical protein
LINLWNVLIFGDLTRPVSPTAKENFRKLADDSVSELFAIEINPG